MTIWLIVSVYSFKEQFPGLGAFVENQVYNAKVGDKAVTVAENLLVNDGLELFIRQCCLQLGMNCITEIVCSTGIFFKDAGFYRGGCNIENL